MVEDDDVWFEQKSFGFGSGLPVAWQGWALLGGFLALIAGANFVLMPRHHLAYYIVVATATVALMVTAARHTRGGWRWRP